MWLANLISFFMHIDKYLGGIISSYGILTYLILFLIIFLETGLVVTPFLPGDSLLFAAGSFAAQGYFNVFLLFAILCFAAILGDSVNYLIGSYLGGKWSCSENCFLNKKYLEKTQEFYNRHGGKTIIIARFMPIVRTFAPFVAGIGKMNYFKFLSYNVIGGILWTGLFVFTGYLFGTIPFVKENFSMVILGIIVLSIIPVAVEIVKSRKKR